MQVTAAEIGVWFLSRMICLFKLSFSPFDSIFSYPNHEFFSLGIPRVY